MEAAAVCARSECRCGIYRLDDDRIQGLHGHAHRPVYLDRYFAGGISTRRLCSRIERPADIVAISKLTDRQKSILLVVLVATLGIVLAIYWEGRHVIVLYGLQYLAR